MMSSERSSHLQSVVQRTLADRFIGALERGDIWPAFQPIVNIKSGALVGYEILARWNDAEVGLVSPAEFIPALERYQLIERLSQALMRTACSAAARWPGTFFLAFNIAPDQLLRETLADWISAIASQTGFPLTRIQLEITESSLICDEPATHRTLARLNAIGISISLDDFGSGYSSLARLATFPFRKLKIDARFVQNLDRDNRKRRIVSMVISLAQSLGLTVVAEGVETEAEAAVLRNLGCPLGQGWLYGRGTPSEEAYAVLKRLGENSARTETTDTSIFQQLHQLQTLYDKAPLGLCFLDQHYRYIRANEIFAEMFGLIGEELEGKTIYDVDDNGQVRELEGLLARATKEMSVPALIHGLDGRGFHIFVHKVVDTEQLNLGFSILAVEVPTKRALEVA